MRLIKNKRVRVLAISMSLIAFYLLNILVMLSHNLLKHKSRYSDSIDLVELLSVLQYLSWLICGYLAGIISR